MKSLFNTDDRAAILARIASVKPDTPRQWGRMSAHGMICHRLDPDTMSHPIFGKLSAGERGRWGYRHLDHHGRQFGV